MRKVLKIFGVLLILLAVAVVGLLAWLSAAEYRPSDREEAQVPANAADPADGFSGSTVRVLAEDNREIARELGISPRTVEVHKARLMAKLQVDSVADLVRLSLQESARGGVTPSLRKP